MPKIYGCVTDIINTARVWESQVSMIKQGLLTLAQLYNVHTLVISEIENQPRAY